MLGIPTPRIHQRLNQVLLLASSSALAAIILAMWVTEYLLFYLRWPLVALLVLLPETLAALRAPVDAFFDDVMVNAEAMDLRLNRQGLLKSLHVAMNRVADLSRLAA